MSAGDPTSSAPGDSRGSRLERLVFQALECHAQDGAAALEAFVAAHPEDAAELRGELERLARVGLLRDPVRAREFPERLGDFRLIERLGEGGMGVVFGAEQVSLKRPVALKLVRPEQLWFAGARERFRREVEAAARLQHPGIVPIYAVGEQDGLPYFAMERLDGCTLADVLRALAGRDPATLTGADLARAVEAASPPREGPEAAARGALYEGSWCDACLRLAQDVALALEHAHSRGVLHRDVKPSNVALTRSGRALLFDFGLALSADESTRLTRSGAQAGSLPYMSPEQVAGQRDLDGRSDVWSLGVTLYELLTLHQPFEAPSTELTRANVLAGAFDRPRRHNRRVHGDVETVVLAALERDRARRTATAGDFARDLANLLAHRPVEASRAGLALRVLRWSQRHPRASAAALAAVPIALLALGVFVWFQIDRGRTEKGLRKVAEDSAVLAARREREAVLEREKVLRLADVKRLQELQSQAAALWPPYPAKIAALSSWLERARALAANLEVHRTTQAEMRTRSLPYTAEDRLRDRETHPHAQELSALQAESAQLTTLMDGGLGGELLVRAEARSVELDARIAELEARVHARRTWRFETTEDQWQHDVLSELIQGLEGLQSGQLGEAAVTPEHGWSVARRLAFAERLRDDFAPGGRYALRWERDLPAIRADHPGLELEPQMGLVPIGRDPASGLWEFWHVASGEEPVRAGDGTLAPGEDMGLVLVLLPGATFWMGAQPGDPVARNHDPQAAGDEAPVHAVTLAAFLLSKYEMTQGQWLRLTGGNPSEYGPHNWRSEWLASLAPPSRRNPVEQVSWFECMDWLQRVGLTLPTEAQWEYGARAGTDTPWWTGAEKESLAGVANLVDLYARDHGVTQWVGHELWLDDGAVVHAPVGTYAPNDFGLCEVAGNVWEWCLDGYEGEFYGRSPSAEPLAPQRGNDPRCYRGGAFNGSATASRSSNRAGNTPTIADDILGVRPAALLGAQ